MCLFHLVAKWQSCVYSSYWLLYFILLKSIYFLLFWNKKIELQSEKGEQIFRHELFHIEQKHSRDIIFLEILTAIFWLNPFFHLKKNLIARHIQNTNLNNIKQHQRHETKANHTEFQLQANQRKHCTHRKSPLSTPSPPLIILHFKALSLTNNPPYKI